MGPEDEIPTEAAAPEPPPAPHPLHHMSVSEIEPLRDLEPGPSFGSGM